MTDRLSTKQTAAMLALMVIAREVSNPDLEKAVGFTLTGQDRTKLNDEGLVESRQKRCYYHKLTDEGWKWCSEEFRADGPPPTSQSSTLTNALYLVTSGVDGYFRREGVELNEVFETGEELTTEEIEERVRKAYRKLARTPRAWVALAELRSRLGGIPHGQVTSVLKELSRTERVKLEPESNRKALTQADHDAAVRIGGDDKHSISIELS
ncbi:hypothetical protein [Actinosynnema pretiosum]|uniref:Uncharacterized protein n=1 Tax=Actinosynnema pretiosum TaxID=42197 RepID=A0A290Z2V0_9PSEU|nr:hypothetical protein [Actinosynnema pretiosum]ATE53273.1 hypothetical protein CNX65_08205 [Actinosynnema pretiosum]